jgi:hypothetical protein
MVMYNSSGLSQGSYCAFKGGINGIDSSLHCVSGNAYADFFPVRISCI